MFELQWIEFPEKRNKALLCYELPPPSLQGYGVSFMLHCGETSTALHLRRFLRRAPASAANLVSSHRNSTKAAFSSR
ncbi:hypothetical protein, partial [Methylacidiphilum sp. Yel]|uniref:hypothetical protein n=1 Tax=Methylacidiphilum sp. Yel TaxID=1847730 RepID=UPI001ABD43BA